MYSDRHLLPIKDFTKNYKITISEKGFGIIAKQLPSLSSNPVDTKHAAVLT